MLVTRALVRERTPRANSCFSALADRSGGNSGSTRDSPSTSRICASAGLMWRKSWRRVSRSEERRVGKEGRSRWAPYHYKKRKTKQRNKEEMQRKLLGRSPVYVMLTKA